MKITCTEKEKERLEFIFSIFDEGDEGKCPLPEDICIDTFLCKDCIIKNLSIKWEIVS